MTAGSGWTDRRRLRARLRRLARFPASRWTEATQGLVFVPPCYFVRPTLGPGQAIVDCGTGEDADFSRALMARFGVRAVGIDPTAKHQPALRALERASGGRFRLLPGALGAAAGRTRFFESRHNVSGSMFEDHVNVRTGASVAYDVDVLSLEDVLARIPDANLGLVKLDVEGAEYDVLDATPEATFARIPQLIVEFHHDTIARFNAADSDRQLRRLAALGFRHHSRDGINYLFFRGA